MSDVQKYCKRQDHHHYHCLFCGQKVADFTGADLDRDYCEHVLYVAHSEGYLYISQRALDRLAEKGFHSPTGEWDDLIGPGEDEELAYVAEVVDAIDLPDAFQIIDEIGPPSLEQTYIGLAPVNPA